MYIPDIELHEATTLDQAAELMARYAPDARLLAGGTDLLVDLKTGRIRVGHLISINRIDALKGLSETNGGLRIGALTTITQLGRATLVQERFAPLLDAITRMAVPQVRNIATVGGNISSAVPCADLPPILMVMNASVVLNSPGGQRTVPLDSFFVLPRQTVIQHNELLSAAVIPCPPPRFGAAYKRFALRDGNAIAVAGVAVSLLLDQNGIIREARIALGAVAPTPKMVESASTALIGKPGAPDVFAPAAEQAMAAAEPISDIRGSADFRREVVGVLTRRALQTAYQRAKENRP